MARTKTASLGRCELCGEQFSKGTISRHLQKCVIEHEPPNAAGKKAQRETYLLSVEGTYLPEYWMRLEMAADSKFGELDLFLRDIWLECCGHMSDFRFPKLEKLRGRGPGAWLDFDDIPNEIDRTMNSKLRDLVEPDDLFNYEYDFGSTTELKLKVVSNRQSQLKRGAIHLLARNLAPEILCGCGQAAKFVCTECVCDGAGWLCKACLKKHECGDEMALPVVNSPRVGVCGYSG
jgi:hypothetical protein